MKPILSTMLVLALAASCSKGEEGSAAASEDRLCTAEEAGAAAAAQAAELLDAVKRSAGATRAAACARFEEVVEDGGKAGIPDRPGCRWDDRNSNGNPRFLISLHLTQLKGQARQACGKIK
jgi:hypothetical protein